MLPAALPAPFSATLSPALLAYLCERGAAGSASGQTACPVRPTLRQSRSCHGHAGPSTLVPVSAPPTEFLFFISLVSDFLTVRISVSSGCARRRSVSTYAAILVLSARSSFFFYLMGLLNGLAILFIFSKNQLLDLLILRIVLLVCMSFNSAVILVMSFLLIALGCLCCCSSSYCRRRFTLFV